MMALDFKAILSAAPSSPCVTRGAKTNNGGSQKQPPIDSPMISAVRLVRKGCGQR